MPECGLRRVQAVTLPNPGPAAMPEPVGRPFHWQFQFDTSTTDILAERLPLDREQSSLLVSGYVPLQDLLSTWAEYQRS